MKPDFLYKFNLKKYLFCLILAFAFSSQLKAAWCMTTNTVNAGVVVPPNIMTSPSFTTTVSGATKSGKIVYWSFVATAGLTYHFDLSRSVTTDSDTQLYIYNGLATTGSSVAANDDYGGGAPASGAIPHHAGIDWTCGASGTYYVVAMNWASVCGATFSNNGYLALNCYYNSAVSCSSTQRNLPFSENFDSWGSCWVATVPASGADWDVWPTNMAGASAPEAVLLGGNACAGCVESSIYRLTQPLKTYSVTSMQLSFRHSLWTTNGGTSGSSTGNLYLETSSDNSTWTQRWTQAYTVAASFSNVIVPTSTVTLPFNPNLGNPSNNNLTYVRFRATGVLFKIYQWYVDMGDVTPLVTLPVELVDFTAEKSGTKEVELKWVTATEKNNPYFIIERSLDGNTFEEIKTVKGSVNSNYHLNYSAIDNNPGEGINYYRLKSMNADNLPSYSQIRDVEFLDDKIYLSDLFPNPTTGVITFDLHTPLKGMLQMQVIDCMGRLIKDESIPVGTGKTTVNNNIEDLATGTYMMKLVFDKTGECIIKKIIRN